MQKPILLNAGFWVSKAENSVAKNNGFHDLFQWPSVAGNEPTAHKKGQDTWRLIGKPVHLSANW